MIKTIPYNTDQILSYAERGGKDGFPVLVQHGLIASISGDALFNKLVDLGARVISIARPGYGRSSPYEMSNMAEWGDIVAALVDHLGLAHFDVFGISSGAPFSYAVGNKFPEKTRRIFILSGVPALYDDRVLAHWPFEVKKDATIAEMEALAYSLFFSNLTPADMENEDIKDSMMNHGFGIAQDFKLRGIDWGFKLPDIKVGVSMRHSRKDDSVPFITAEMTAAMLPNCTLDVRENDVHFSQDVVDDFIETVMADYLGNRG